MTSQKCCSASKITALWPWQKSQAVTCSSTIRTHLHTKVRLAFSHLFSRASWNSFSVPGYLRSLVFHWTMCGWWIKLDGFDFNGHVFSLKLLTLQVTVKVPQSLPTSCGMWPFPSTLLQVGFHCRLWSWLVSVAESLVLVECRLFAKVLGVCVCKLGVKTPNPRLFMSRTSIFGHKSQGIGCCVAAIGGGVMMAFEVTFVGRLILDQSNTRLLFCCPEKVDVAKVMWIVYSHREEHSRHHSNGASAMWKTRARGWVEWLCQCAEPSLTRLPSCTSWITVQDTTVQGRV